MAIDFLDGNEEIRAQSLFFLFFPTSKAKKKKKKKGAFPSPRSRGVNDLFPILWEQTRSEGSSGPIDRKLYVRHKQSLGSWCFIFRADVQVVISSISRTNGWKGTLGRNSVLCFLPNEGDYFSLSYLLMNVISKRKRNELSELLLGLENWRKVLLFFPFLLFFPSSFLSLAGYGFSLFSYKNVPTGLVLRLTVLI